MELQPPSPSNVNNNPCADTQGTQSNEPQQGWHVLIVTALDLEYMAVRAFLNDLREISHPSGILYEQGLFINRGFQHTILLVEARKGNINAAVETDKAIDYFRPEIAVFVGIAGGIKDVKIGDVVVADKVYGYETGKARTSFEPRTETHNSSYRLVQRATAEKRNADWLHIGGMENDSPIPNVFVAPIAAGEKVVASTQAPLFRYIREHYSDAVALEMEGIGFLRAAFEHQEVQSIVIRGISDLIDNKAETDSIGSQDLAAKRASAFAFHLITTHVKPRKEAEDDTQTSVRQEQYSGIVVQLEKDFLGEEIEVAKDSLRQRRDEEALVLLNRIERDKWTKLNDRQKRTVLSHIAVIHLKRLEFEKAAEKLIKADPYGKEDETTQSNLVAAFLLRGEEEKASAHSLRLIQKYPKSKAVWMNYLQVIPQDKSMGEIEKEVPQEILESADIISTLALRAHLQGNDDYGLTLSSKACTLDPDCGSAWVIRGICLYSIALADADSTCLGLDHLSQATKERLIEAEEYFSKAIQLGEEQKDLRLLGDPYLKRSEIRNLLGRTVVAKADMTRFCEILPDHPIALMEKAKKAEKDGEHAETERLMRAAYSSGKYEPIISFELAKFLGDCSELQKKKEAAVLLFGIVRDPKYSLELRIRAGTGFVLLHKEMGSLDVAQEQIEAIADNNGCTDPFLSNLLLGILFLESTNLEKAKSAILCAYEGISQSTSKSAIRTVADLLTRIKECEQALNLWMRLKGFFQKSDEYLGLLSCAQSLEREDIILKTCEEIRSTGTWDERMIRCEVNLLQRYNPEKAIEILKSRLFMHPNDLLANTLLSSLGIRLRKPELLVLKPEMVPQPLDIDPLYGIEIANALKASGFTHAAIDLAYRLLRLNYGEPNLRMAYIGLFLNPFSHFGPSPKFEEVDEVQIGTAVEWIDMDNGGTNWIIIEDTDQPKFELNEYSPDHALSCLLLGHKVQDAITINLEPFPKTIKIKEIRSKYLHRYLVLVEAQSNVPDDKIPFWVFSIKKPGMKEDEVDFGPLMDFMKGDWEKIEKRREMYRKHFCPAYLLAQNTIKSVWDISQHRDLRLRVCTGNPVERVRSQILFADGKPIIMDLTAFATVYLLDWIEVFDLLSDQLFITPGAKAAILESIDTDGNSFGFLEPTSDGFYPVIKSEEQKHKEIERNREYAKCISEKVGVTNATELAFLPSDKRNDLVKIFGEDGAEAIIVSSRPDHILWTDDLVVSIAAADFNPHGSSRIWTDVVSEALHQSDRLAADTRLTHAAKLLGWGYVFTPFSPSILLKLCSLLDWRSSSQCLHPVFDQISDQKTIGLNLPKIIVEFFKHLYREPLTETTRTLITTAFLNALRNRQDAHMLTLQIRRELPLAFGLNLLGLSEAMKTMDEWLRIAGG